MGPLTEKRDSYYRASTVFNRWAVRRVLASTNLSLMMVHLEKICEYLSKVMALWHGENELMFLLEHEQGSNSTIGRLPGFYGGLEDEPPLDVVLLLWGAMER